jgi:hypothetical protein
VTVTTTICLQIPTLFYLLARSPFSLCAGFFNQNANKEASRITAAQEKLHALASTD